MREDPGAVNLEVGGLSLSVKGAGEREKETIVELKKFAFPFFARESKVGPTLFFETDDEFYGGEETTVDFSEEKNLLRIKTDGCDFSFSFASFNGHARLSPPLAAAGLKKIVRNIYSWLFLREGGLVLHACGILRDETADVFAGPSFSGKSTIVSLSPGRKIINEDVIFIRKIEDDFFVSPAPPWGTDRETIRGETLYPLKAVFVLSKGKETFLREIKGSEGLPRILTLPKGTENFFPWEGLLDRFAELLKKIPLYELCFYPSYSVWDVIDDRIGDKS